MSRAIAILFKELRVAFTTPVAYVVICVFTLVTSFFFIRLLTGFQRKLIEFAQMNPQQLAHLNFTDGVLSPLFHNVAVILVFAIPFLTMRLVAEERRTGTIELLMTCPIRPLQIVVGKYCASLVVLVVMLSLLLVYPLLVAAYAVSGSVEWPTVLSGLGGLFLLGAAFSALGLFVSTLTRSQTIAAFVTWFLLMLLWLVGWAAGDNAGATRTVLEALSAVGHIKSFVAGAIDLRDLTYYLSLIAFGVFLAHRSLVSMRWR